MKEHLSIFNVINYLHTINVLTVNNLSYIYNYRREVLNLNENLAVTLGGGFFGGILIGYALKKIIKIVAIIAGFFLAALAYLQYQQIANINWDRLQAISENTLTTLANVTQQIPGFDGTSNVPLELVMTNLGIPLTGSLAIGFTIGFMRG
jgi:uncharacterized membrane protein (Fun14 family)